MLRFNYFLSLSIIITNFEHTLTMRGIARQKEPYSQPNLSRLKGYFIFSPFLRFNEAVKQGYLNNILDEIVLQSKVEFNYTDEEDEE